MVGAIAKQEKKAYTIEEYRARDGFHLDHRGDFMKEMAYGAADGWDRGRKVLCQ